MSKDFDIASIFNDILKYHEKYRGETLVIKFGGSLAESDSVIRSLARQVAFLSNSMGAKIVLVHGGGKQIDDALARAKIEIKRDPKTGLRITDKETLAVSDDALRLLNGRVVRLFQEESATIQAIGFAGYEARLVHAQPVHDYTGQPAEVNVDFLNRLLEKSSDAVIPIIYPICWSDSAEDLEKRLNVNADDAAAAIAGQIGARRLILCSDTPGVLDKDGNRLTGLSTLDIEHLIESGTVTGGMIPKLRAAAEAADQLKMGGVVILDGRKDNFILAELLSEDGVGTLIRSPERIRDLGLERHYRV